MGWVGMDPADVAKVMRQETPEWIKSAKQSAGCAGEQKSVRRLGRQLDGLQRGPRCGCCPTPKARVLGFLMYPAAENAAGRLDSYAPDDFKYQISAKELKGVNPQLGCAFLVKKRQIGQQFALFCSQNYYSGDKTMAASKLILDYVFEHEKNLADQVYLTQPIGGGQTIDYTWAEALDQSRRMAAHLKAQNFEPGARIAILSKNSAHFMMAELAIWMAGCTTVAIFPTETAETISYVLEHSGASLLFVGKLDIWPQQKSGVPAQPALYCTAAVTRRTTTKHGMPSPRAPSRLTGKLQRAGTDIAILLYTSGSTGTPKGVMHNFERITRVSESITKDIKSRIGNGDNRVLSYLPLAHVFERAWVECASFVDGKTHVFFAESLDSFVQDLNRARPTIFISVPRLWLKFQQGVFAKMPPAKALAFAEHSYPERHRQTQGAEESGPGPGLAGRQRLGAHSRRALIAWYRRLGLNLIEGYAMSEDFAYSHNSTPEINEPGCVGVPLPGVQVRISEEGEILIKSPGQLVGYYKRPDLDKEVFHRRRLLPHRRPGRAPCRWLAEDHGPREGNLQNIQG